MTKSAADRPIKKASWPRGCWERIRDIDADFEIEPMRPTLQDIAVRRP